MDKNKENQKEGPQESVNNTGNDTPSLISDSAQRHFLARIAALEQENSQLRSNNEQLRSNNQQLNQQLDMVHLEHEAELQLFRNKPPEANQQSQQLAIQQLTAQLQQKVCSSYELTLN